MRLTLALCGLLALAGCATPRTATPDGAGVAVRIIAFNDFHGALEPPRLAVPAAGAGGTEVRVPAGGAAYLASAVARLRAANPNHAVVSAGDLISASPLVSAQFLDEPTILAMNSIGLDFNAVGNHEFDRGSAELLRMQNGGCGRNTSLQPCRVDTDFPGASFRFLAANVRTASGATLFPATAMRTFGRVQVGFVGLTLKDTATLVTPAGVAGLTFDDEAETINTAAARLRADGADAVVVLIHQGLSTKVPWYDRGCSGMDGGLLPILGKLDRGIDVVVSGHTHNAYICDYGSLDPSRPFLVTSAGRSGTMLTAIDLVVDPAKGVVSRKADAVIVQGEGHEGAAGSVAIDPAFERFAAEPGVAAIVARYAAAAAPITNRVVARMSGPALRAAAPSGESTLANLIADAQLAATRSPADGGAQIAFMNQYGVRADIVPGADGAVTYGQLFAAQPFGNSLVVKTLTGRQLRALLEQQFDSGSNSVARPNLLLPSRGFRFSYDLARPAGARIVAMSLDGRPVADDGRYRVTVNNFLAAGGDNFTVLAQGSDAIGGPQDLDALERYMAGAGRLDPPATDRVTRIGEQVDAIRR